MSNQDFINNLNIIIQNKLDILKKLPLTTEPMKKIYSFYRIDYYFNKNEKSIIFTDNPCENENTYSLLRSNLKIKNIILEFNREVNNKVGRKYPTLYRTYKEDI